MSLPNQDTSVMDALRQPELEHAGLQSSLQEILHFERQHIIKLHSGFIKHTDTYETANERISLEETFGVFLVERE